MANVFLNNAQGVSVDSLYGPSDYLAYQTWLIDLDTIGVNTYYSSINQIGQNQYAEISDGTIMTLIFSSGI